MAEERIPTLIPGDEFAYLLVFVCKVNARMATAAFRNERTGSEVILRGEASLIDKPRVVGGRTQAAALSLDYEESDELESGRYRLARVEVQTYGGRSLDFDNPPRTPSCSRRSRRRSTWPSSRAEWRSRLRRSFCRRGTRTDDRSSRRSGSASPLRPAPPRPPAPHPP